MGGDVRTGRGRGLEVIEMFEFLIGVGMLAWAFWIVFLSIWGFLFARRMAAKAESAINSRIVQLHQIEKALKRLESKFESK